jgi:hypothetical protein
VIRRLLFFAVAVLFVSIPAFGDGFDQTVQFGSSTGAPVSDGYSISPYSGTLNGQAAEFYCVDFTHNFGVPTSWNAAATSITGASSFAGTLQYALNGSSTSTAYNNYLEMAWLITVLQANLNNGDLGDATLDQLAIWTFSGYVNDDPTNEDAIAALLADASMAVTDGFTVSGWEVLTPDYANNPNAQEMIVTSPEPSTVLMLIAGSLVAVFLTFLQRA